MTQEEFEALPRDYQAEVLEAAKIRKGRFITGDIWGWRDPGHIVANDITLADLQRAAVRVLENQRFREWVPPEPNQEFDKTWDEMTNS